MLSSEFELGEILSLRERRKALSKNNFRIWVEFFSTVWTFDVFWASFEIKQKS